MTRAARSFYIVLILALVAVSSAALVPHHDTEDARCLVCKVGSQPFEPVQTASSAILEAPLVRPLAPEKEPPSLPTLPVDNASRAPPL